MSFVRYNPEDSVVSTETVVRPMWSGDSNVLSTFFTSSAITSSFYLNVYSEYPGALTSTSSSIQMAVQYGNKYGSGSTYISPSVTTNLPDGSAITPTRVVYGQYRTLLLGTESGSFEFGNDNPNGIYVINVARNRYKEHIQPGSMTLKLKSTTFEVILTDNSQVTSTTNYTTNGLLYYTLISGSGGILGTAQDYLLKVSDAIKIGSGTYDAIGGAVTTPSLIFNVRLSAETILFSGMIHIEIATDVKIGSAGCGSWCGQTCDYNNPASQLYCSYIKAGCANCPPTSSIGSFTAPDVQNV